MGKQLIGHYVTRIFVDDDDMSPSELSSAQCDFCGMHQQIDALFDNQTGLLVEIETTNEMPWNGCDCAR